MSDSGAEAAESRATKPGTTTGGVPWGEKPEGKGAGPEINGSGRIVPDAGSGAIACLNASTKSPMAAEPSVPPLSSVPAGASADQAPGPGLAT